MEAVTFGLKKNKKNKKKQLLALDLCVCFGAYCPFLVSQNWLYDALPQPMLANTTTNQVRCQGGCVNVFKDPPMQPSSERAASTGDDIFGNGGGIQGSGGQHACRGRPCYACHSLAVRRKENHEGVAYAVDLGNAMQVLLIFSV
jgi:hypothetical protein